MQLQRLSRDHADAVLAFERDNRTWFARSISDRGDDYFAHFAERYDALLAEQADGVCAFFVLVDDDSTVVGRFNLYDLEDGHADVGYRVAEGVAGRGIATAALRHLCRIAARELGLHTLSAATSDENEASRRLLLKVGFVPVRPAGPDDLGGRTGTWFELRLGR